MENIENFVDKCEENLSEIFKQIDSIALFNQKKVLNAFARLKIGARHFAGTTGYGYDDIGRDNLYKLFAIVFGGESAIVSPLITCGSHAITTVLYGLLRPNDTMLSVAGKPYDTLDETIKGKADEDNGSLKDFGVKYEQIDLKDDKLDFEQIEKKSVELKPKVVFLQRSRGYGWRSPLSIDDFKKVADIVKKVSPESYVVVDNCYGEFTSTKEPCEVGADIVVGSLIKNPGGGLAGTGGYIVGTTKAINQISSRFTSSSLGLEVGSFEGGYRNYYQGLFVAPHTVAGALKGACLLGEVMNKLGYEILPSSNEIPKDIIKSIKFDTAEELISFVQLIQKYSPIDSDAVPMPWDMPGYTDQVIMAAGTFVGGASIELSCDSPIKSPYIAYFQGGLTYEHIKLVAIEVAGQYSK